MSGTGHGASVRIEDCGKTFVDGTRALEPATLDKKSRVVVVSTANGLKFTEFKVRYHERALPGVSSRGANPPIELPADLDKVVEAIGKHHGIAESMRPGPRAN